MRSTSLFRPGSYGVLLLLLACLAACDKGDRGSPGPEGPPGPPGPPTTGEVTALSMTITGATLGSPSTVDFKLANQHEAGYTGLPASALEVTIAKLVPGTDGDPDSWQSYINITQAPNGTGAGTTPTIVATTDTGGSLADHGDGSYTYTFGTNLSAVTSPLAVSFDPALTHRIALAIRSSTLPQANNAIYDFQPSTGATSGIASRNMIDTASCNSCHTRLAAHGGPRQDVRECVTCHNPGSTEASSGNTLDFEVMIHKIHRGANLPSVKAGAPYLIYGHGNSKHDYSDVVFPQDVRNCTKCHDPASSNTPDAHLAFSQPTIQACGACHDNIDFSKGEAGGHAGGVVTDNTQCTVCHAANRVAGSVEDSHIIATKAAAANFKYNLISASNTRPGQKPVVVFSVTNPNNADQPYDIKSDPAFTKGGSQSALSVDIAWTTTPDYGNVGTGSNPGQPVRINALTAASANGDGSFTVTSPAAVPSTMTGSLAVAIEGHPWIDLNGNGAASSDERIPVTGVVQYYGITDAPATPRRAVVTLAKCQSCHGTNDGLSFHGGNRTDNVELCAVCHNPNATDVSYSGPAGAGESPINFDYMIHSIHGAAKRKNDYVVYGFGGSKNDFADVRYPGTVANCTQCHADETYTLPLAHGAPGLLGTTVNTSAPPAMLADSSTYLRITPTAAACSACHDDSTSKAHMEQTGGNFWLTQAAIGSSGSDTESCAVCHGPGSIADVRFVHKLD
jgi:OmcA/MtrC family decaheme c-type cytochrome